MGIFRKILAEGKDLASVVDGIKKAVMNFKAHQDQEEALFGKELTKVEDQASKALLAIAKVLEQNKVALEAMGDEKWAGKVNQKLAECGQTVMGLADPLATTLAEFREKPKPSGTSDCKACKGSGLMDGEECEVCQGTGALEPVATASEGKKTGKTENDDDDFDGRERRLRSGQRPNLPCPRCKAKNVLTPDDSARGRVCDTCADAAERGHGRYGYSFENKKAKK